MEEIAESCDGANIDRWAKASTLLDRCQAGVFELWVPSGVAARGCEVKDRPQGVGVRGSARVLAGVGHLAAHLSAPEVADCAIDASEDGETGDVAIVGADVGAGVVGFSVGVDLQVLPATFFLELEEAFDRRACSDGEGDTLAQVSGGAFP